MLGSEFGKNNMKAWIHPALYPSYLVSMVQAAAGGVMMWGLPRAQNAKRVAQEADLS